MYISPWLRIPPDIIRNKYNALTSFVIPKSFLERKLKIYVAVKDTLKELPHAMPNIVIGSTDVLDVELRKLLYSYDHERTVFPVRYIEDTPVFESIILSKCRIEMSCHP